MFNEHASIAIVLVWLALGDLPIRYRPWMRARVTPVVMAVEIGRCIEQVKKPEWQICDTIEGGGFLCTSTSLALL